MVVVVIIGVLVAVAIPVYNNVTDNAKERACQSNLRIIDGAIQMWVADDPTNNVATAVTMGDLVTDFIDETPKCPTDGDDYTFTNGKAVCPNGHTY